MNDVPKVLVVDSGDRIAEDLFSTQLAELGFASVTTSFEAADDVLGLIARPSAIVLNMPRPSDDADYVRFVEVAHDLKVREPSLGIPVIVWDRLKVAETGGIATLLSAFREPAPAVV